MGRFIYGEWLVPIVDYYRILKNKEFNYEIVIPLILSAIVTGLYGYLGCVLPALLKLRDVLPASLAILIGFSITCITILITSNTDNIAKIKEKKTDNRTIGSKVISIYQWFLILFIYVLLIQIFLLMVVFFTAFVLRVYSNSYFITGLLFIEVSLTLHVLFILIRNISNFYFVFFKNDKDE